MLYLLLCSVDKCSASKLCLVPSDQFCLYGEVSKEKVGPLEQFAEENDLRQRDAISFGVVAF